MNNLLIVVIIILAAMTRLVPHPPNFTPIIAIGLLGGAYISNRTLAIIVPIFIMIISDFYLGFHSTIYWVYFSLIFIALLGFSLRTKMNMLNGLLSGISGSVIFFIITNFGVWFSSSFYPKTFQGLLLCYSMAIPFFINTLVSTLFYLVVMLAGYRLYNRAIVHSMNS